MTDFEYDPAADPDAYDLRLSATFIPDDELRMMTVAVGGAQGSTVITPKLDGLTVTLEVVTNTPALELAEVLEAIAEGLRAGTVIESEVTA